MTQMGLEYRKYLLDKQIRPGELAVKEREAGAKESEAATKAYTASFEPIRIEMTGKQAEASAEQARAATKQADVAQHRADTARAEAYVKQQEANIKQQEADRKEWEAWMQYLPSFTREGEALMRAGYDEGGAIAQMVLSKFGSIAEDGLRNIVKSYTGGGMSLDNVDKDHKTVTVTDSVTGEQTTYRRRSDGTVVKQK